MLVGIPLFAAALWFAVGILLIAGGLIQPFASHEVQIMSTSALERYSTTLKASSFWSELWLSGLGLIFILGIISFAAGMHRLMQLRHYR